MTWIDPPPRCNIHDFITGIHAPFELTCGDRAMDRLASCHCGWEKGGECQRTGWGTTRKRKEDRLWKHECNQAKLVLGVIYTCAGNVGDHNQECTCPHDSAVVRIDSEWFGKNRDRSYVVTCAKLKYDVTFACSWDEGWTQFDHYFDSFVKTEDSDTRYILAGIKSEHSNDNEDRKFKFRYCRYCSIPHWSEWSHFHACAFCRDLPEDATFGETKRTRQCITKTPGIDDPLCQCQGHTMESRQCPCLQTTTTTSTHTPPPEYVYSNATNSTLNEDNVEEERESDDSLNLPVVNNDTISENITGTNKSVAALRQGFLVFELAGDKDEEGYTPKMITIFLSAVLAAVALVVTVGYMAYSGIKARHNATPLEQNGDHKMMSKKKDEKSPNKETYMSTSV